MARNPITALIEVGSEARAVVGHDAHNRGHKAPPLLQSMENRYDQVVTRRTWSRPCVEVILMSTAPSNQTKPAILARDTDLTEESD